MCLSDSCKDSIALRIWRPLDRSDCIMLLRTDRDQAFKSSFTKLMLSRDSIRVLCLYRAIKGRWRGESSETSHSAPRTPDLLMFPNVAISPASTVLSSDAFAAE